jgi:hypothetical protein
MLTATETPCITAHDRAEILGYASWLLPRSDRGRADLATSWAEPLLEWAAQAASKDDLTARMTAMSQQYQNTRMASLNPDEFLAETRTRYAFIIAGNEG